MVMEADKVIYLAQYLSNRTRPVYRFTIDYLGQDRGQRSWSANVLNSLNSIQDMLLSSKLDQRQVNFNVYMYK